MRNPDFQGTHTIFCHGGIEELDALLLFKKFDKVGAQDAIPHTMNKDNLQEMFCHGTVEAFQEIVYLEIEDFRFFKVFGADASRDDAFDQL